MVKRISSAIACCLILLAASCVKEQFQPREDGPAREARMEAVTFEASFSETVKTTLDGLKPVWLEGDRISLFGATGVNSPLSVENPDGGNATFSGTAEADGPFTAVYPYSDGNAMESGSVVATVPTEQKLDGSAVAPGAMLSVARTEGKKLSFKNICGLLRITVADEGVTAITIRSLDGSPLSGTVAVNPETAEIKEVKNGSDQIVLLPKEASFAPGTYSVAAIPGKKKGITVALSRATDARKGAKSSANTLDLPRNTSISLGSFRTTGLEWGYRIGNYADLLAWKNDKANWDSEGETVLFTGDVDMKDEPWTTLTDSYPGEIQGNGHCISHINIQSSSSANVGFFGKNYAKEIHDLTFGSEDGKTYDGTSCIISSYQTTSTSAYWSYTAPITLPGADVMNVTNFIPITVKSTMNRSSRTGGIAAWVTSKVSIIGCHNYGIITVEDHTITEGSSYKYLAAGGILGGANTADAVVTVSDCHNHATIHSNNHSMMGMGGIVGFSYATPTSVTVTGCTNDGNLELVYSATQNDFFAAGGIFGRSASKAASDGGPTCVISDCTNKGKVYSEAVHQHYVGGIVGRSDGTDISSCRNEGVVEIDHTAHPTTRFQHMGGIVGGTMTDGGSNSLRNNDNSGTLTMKVASSGHNKTPSSSTTYYGVNAGGIIGMANKVSAIEGNTNSGTILAENAFSASNAAYPATVNAGGILGYDFGTVDRFADNTSTGTVQAKTTKATSVPAEVYAGGNIGRIREATILSGNGTGTVKAESSDAAAHLWAGSIAGYNGGTIVTCSYGGTVNGATADDTNIVGGGNAPQSSGGDPLQGGEFSVSETAVEFPGGGFSRKQLTASAGDKPVTITAEGLDWLKLESIPEGIEAGSATIITLLPATGNVCDTREGTLTFTEQGGETRTVTITQGDLYTPVDGFPARWEIVKGSTYTEGNTAGKRWLNEGVAETVCADAAASSPGTGYISAGSTTGNKLVYSVAPSGTQNISIGNMGEGDYIQFSVPTVSMPAGTDIDFMVTINTNNNKTPKYWLFEYWDGGEWKAQPRYTATEDGTTRYSLDVFDYDSKNHRTYITTFRLGSAVNNDFVKMRLRAVGPFNCNGDALVPTPNAYMNFPCMTYHSCVIAAYPGIPAKESTPVKLLQLGNSFTYYNGSAFKLKQICRAEGHATDVRINVKGSQEFEHHLDLLPFSQRLVAEGGYDKAILQDGSYFHAEYGAGDASAIQGVEAKYSPEEILALTKRMTAAVKANSSGADIILESTWSYPYKTVGNFLGFGSYENFDAMMWKGVTEIAAADPNVNWISPIGKAFALARSDTYGYKDSVNYLLYTDNYHPHRYGSYLKACVNYLILFGEPFGSHPADCDIPAADAAKLREIATKIVLDAGRDTYHVR